jgi:uncharacterized protein (TIGR02145 family)
MSGDFTTILSDSPVASRIYDVEFSASTDPDRKNYSVVNIGTQTWMAENLAWLPAVSPSSDGSEISPFYYVYKYEGSSISEAKSKGNYTSYGVLYNWEAAKIACPSGCHLPTDKDWAILQDYLGKLSGRNMKSIAGWLVNGYGDNGSGFNGLPGGSRGYEGGFGMLGYETSFWSSSEYGLDGLYAWIRNLECTSDILLIGSDDLSEGNSVRCLLND